MGVQPHRSLCRLAHFFAFRRCKQGESCSISHLLFLASYEVGSCKHIAPLVVPSHLQHTAVLSVEVQKVVGLHQHVVEFQKCQALFQSLFVTFRSEHFIDGKTRPDIPQKIDVIQVAQPVGVVGKNCFAVGNVDKACHLFFETLHVVGDGFLGHHLTHVGASRRISHHCRASADKHNGTVACTLHVRHSHKRYEMPHMQTVRSWVVSRVKGNLFAVKQFVQFLFVHNLFEVTSLFQNIQNIFHTILQKAKRRIFKAVRLLSSQNSSLHVKPCTCRNTLQTQPTQQQLLSTLQQVQRRCQPKRTTR